MSEHIFLTPATCDHCNKLMFAERPNLSEHDPLLNFCQDHGGSGILMIHHDEFIQFAREYSVFGNLPLSDSEVFGLACDFCIDVNHKRGGLDDWI